MKREWMEPPMPKPVPMDFASVMNRAANSIEKRGNAKGEFYGAGGSLCAYAAVAEEAGVADQLVLGRVASTHHDRLDIWLSRVAGMGICRFNNSHSGEEVIQMLRRAAREA
jgi:hypothetical protein